MKRIQFYPNQALEKVLDREAQALGVSTSALVVEILSNHYGLANKYPEAKIIKKVLDEVEAYIANPASNREFDLLHASKTFAEIEMAIEGKPSIMRAKIGKAFGKQIGTGAFANVERAYRPNGKIKKSVNNATIYRIK